MSTDSLDRQRTPSNGSRRKTKAAWAVRKPPADPIDRVSFRLTRMRIVLAFRIPRDLAELRHEIEAAAPSASMRRRWQREYRALMRELAGLGGWARGQRLQLRRLRDESPDRAWLRRQLATLDTKG